MADGNINMLGIRKVKLHGMSSTRWTARDKLTQYKGLISLYTRDRKVIEFDTGVARKKLDQDLKQLQKLVDVDRGKLDNVIRGDKQQLRNTLAEHKGMQLAYQNSPPKKVIESLLQINFAKRKTSDRLEYELQQKIKFLEDLKLNASVLEDRLKYAFLGQIQQEKEAQIITGKVQDAILKREGAIAIKQSYEKMIAIMKKDALYFNAILETIQNDGMIQNRCFLNATKLGQLATEYLDDRRLEFLSLEKAVARDITQRRTDLTNLRNQVVQNGKKIQKLMRGEDDLTICDFKGMDDSPRSRQLKKDMSTVETSLQQLKKVTLMPNYEKIYPCMQEQAKQKERLDALSARVEKNRNIIASKLENAELMANSLKNTMVESTGDYKKRKAEIIKKIEHTNDHKKRTSNVIDTRNHLIASVTSSLRHVQQFLKTFEKESKKKSKMQGQFSSINAVPPDIEEHDGAKILTELVQSVTVLLGYDKECLDEKTTDEAYKLFEQWIKTRTITIEFNEFDLKSSSLKFSEKSHLLTREDIKKQSREIVEANTKTDDALPGATPAKK